jgi:outer membrane protein
VDIERAVIETTEGQRIQSTLKKLFEAKHGELNKQQEALNKERDAIDKQRHTLSAAALAQRAEKWQRDAMQLQQRFEAYNQDLQRKEGELTSPVFQKAMSIIRRLASQEGIDVVVDRKAAPHIRGDLDLTDRVIQMHNSGAGGDATGGAAAPAPAAPRAPAPATPPRVAPSKP